MNSSLSRVSLNLSNSSKRGMNIYNNSADKSLTWTVFADILSVLLDIESKMHDNFFSNL
jgi:hypothetical protein